MPCWASGIALFSGMDTSPTSSVGGTGACGSKGDSCGIVCCFFAKDELLWRQKNLGLHNISWVWGVRSFLERPRSPKARMWNQILNFVHPRPFEVLFYIPNPFPKLYAAAFLWNGMAWTLDLMRQEKRTPRSRWLRSDLSSFSWDLFDALKVQ